MISTDTTANVTDGWAASHRTLREEMRTARGLALACVAVYLLLSAALLAVSGRLPLVILHLVLAGVTIITMTPRTPLVRLVGDVLPLVVVPVLYAEIPALIAAAGSPYHDVWIQQVELAVFGGQPSRTFARTFPNLLVSELLHAGYLSYYPLIFAPPLVLLLRNERPAFSRTVLALTLTYLACWVLFVCFPVQGPRFLWGPSDAPDGPVRRATLSILAAGSSRGAAFPSSHMAVSVAQAIAALRWQRRLGWVVLVLAFLVGLGAVYGGFHYATDIIAGAALGAVIAGLVTRWH